MLGVGVGVGGGGGGGAGGAGGGWAPPPLWHFPPFFTLQPNDATRARQLDEWARMIVSWATAFNHPSFAPLGEWPLWENKAIARRLPPDGVRAVADALVASGRAEWADGGARAALRIAVHTPAEWAALIIAHVDRTGHINGEVLTVAELQANVLGAAFAALDQPTLLRALDELARRVPPAAELYPADTGLTDDNGVKFRK